MKVTIDPDSGFCFGVNNAIRIAESELESGNPVYCLGEMVHNSVQMDQLISKGLKVISKTDMAALKGEMVMFRAHGEPPETYQLAKELEISIIDATCPIVTKLQKRINEAFLQENSIENQIVIFGKPGHAEIAGLNGNAGNEAILITDECDLTKIDFSKPISLFSQTTMGSEEYNNIAVKIKKLMDDCGNHDLVINKSVCKQVSGRAPSLRVFAFEHDVILFVGGNNSANGAYLFGICKAINPESYYISDIKDIDSKWFENAKSIGVSGATSTPGWLIEKVATYVKWL